MKIKCLFVGVLLSLTLPANAFSFQQPASFADTTAIPNDWFLLDPEVDHVQGLSVARAYTLLQGKPSRNIIVAVLDTGVDFDHEDLKDVMWTNPKEIAGNGKDDDKNGYVDDIHGWSFIGGKNGDVKRDTYELTREYVRLNAKYKTITEQTVSKKDQVEYAYWLIIQKTFTEAKEKNESDYKSCAETLEQYDTFYKNLSSAIQYVKSEYNVTTISARLIDTLAASGPKTRAAKYVLNIIYDNEGRDTDVEAVADELKRVIDHNKEVCDNFKNAIDYGYNVEFDPRPIVGDTYSNTEERYYGNNNVKGTYPVHGTHVAGIIAANRNNNIGIQGIADHVKIMALRVVPNGDERDKDIANAIRYAVDNGARIINMSFGKDYSPQKEAVDKAVQYAESKNVLLIHAAGNDDDNNDLRPSYPTGLYKNGKQATNWLEVGAAAWGADSTLAADFSNYGKKMVDVFAPGVQLYSTTPSNKYEPMDGTSFAAPATAGVAAIIMSYFPTLTAAQVKDILMRSTRKFDGLNVKKSDKTGVVPFSELSKSGGLVNAYEAVKLALSLKGGNATE
jgi:cell wall-associated protease